MRDSPGHFEFAVNNFDLIRLLAASQVVLIHGFEHLQVPGSSEVAKLLGLFPGVPIFFVTSGYLISASYERNPRLTSYLRNRALRIYPALWACLLVSIASVLVVFGNPFLDRAAVPWLIAQTTIGQFYNPEFLRDYGVGTLNGSLWTIPVELQFYLILPLLYPVIRRAFASATIAVAMIGALIAVNATYNELHTSASSVMKLIGVSLAPYLCMFLLGVYFQRHRRLVGRWMAGRAIYWLAALLGWSVIASEVGLTTEGNYLNPVSILLLAGLTLAAAYSRPQIAGRVLRGNDVSYGVYIYHMVVINVLVEIGMTRSWIALAVATLATFTLATTSWLLVERPALALKAHPRPAR